MEAIMRLLGEALKRLGYAVLGKERVDQELKDWDTVKQLDPYHNEKKKRR